MFQNSITHKDAIYASWKDVNTEFARSRVNAYVKRSSVELYDLKADPWCFTNLADQKGTAKVQAKFAAKMDGWMQQQGDLGDATERAANDRQPQIKPWGKGGVYEQQSRAY